ncbi:MAG: PilZ domain-containing protein [Bacillota bacterium]
MLKLSETRRVYTRRQHSQYVFCNQFQYDDTSELIILSSQMKSIMLDISTGGIGLLSEYKFEIGNLLYLKLSLENDEHEVKSKVIYCKPVGEMFRIGVEFVDTNEFILDAINKFFQNYR